MFKISLLSLFTLFTVVFTVLAIDEYIGETYIYLFFTVASSLLVYIGFRKNAIFFDTFLGIFLWLGFWLKTTVNIVFYDSRFKEGLSTINISPDVFDESLFVSSIAFISFILASYVREKFFFTYSAKEKENVNGLFIFYKKHRKKILFLYVFIFLLIGFSNLYLGIYQRGEISKTILPFGMNGVYKWLLLFGLSTYATLILKYEFNLQKRTGYFVPILVLIESFITNVSLFSRGMVLNSSSIGYGMLKHLKSRMIRIDIKFLFILIFVFVFLFLISISVVDTLRKDSMDNTKVNVVTNITSKQTVDTPFYLLIKRWVGAEGMLAVSNSDAKGWALFKKAMAEKPGDYATSFYDANLINSPYKNMDMSTHHYISLPGFIAFFYYANSILFLSIIIFLLSLFASFLEYLSYKADAGNFMLAALIAQVVAYRYTHFGYAPAQSYLLFGSIVLNLFLIYGVNKIASLWYKKELEDVV